MSHKCPSCGKELNKESICPYCGTVLSIDAYEDEMEEQFATEPGN